MTPSAHYWRDKLPSWPDARRQAWGERANALEALGMPWELAEEQAYLETEAPAESAVAPQPKQEPRGKVRPYAPLFD